MSWFALTNKITKLIVIKGMDSKSQRISILVTTIIGFTSYFKNKNYYFIRILSATDCVRLKYNKFDRTLNSYLATNVMGPN